MLQQESPPEDLSFPPQLPPLNNLPQWSRVNTLDRARYPKPFRKDRPALPPTSGESGGADDDDAYAGSLTSSESPSGVADNYRAQHLQHLERNLKFLQMEHKNVLQSLHQEIDALKRQNQDLQFRIIMVQRGTPVPPSNSSPEKVPSPPTGVKSSSAKLSRESSRVKKSSSEATSASNVSPQTHTEEKIDEVRNVLLEDEILELKKVLQEERSKNEYLSNVIEQAQARFMENENVSEAMSAPPHMQTGGATKRHTTEPQVPARESLPYNAKLDPLTVLDMTGAHRPPTVEECEVIIKHLLRMNDKQTHELSQLKTDLRDVLYSHKWSPDAYLLAKAYVVEDEPKAGSATRERLPRLQLRQQTRKLPDAAHIQRDAVMLPALKQTMGNKAIERRKRTQTLQKTRTQRRQVQQ